MSNLNYSPVLVTYFAMNSEPSLCNYHFFSACLKYESSVFALCFASANFLSLIRKSNSSLSSSFIYLQVFQSPPHPSVAGCLANKWLPSLTKQNKKIITFAEPIHISRSSVYLIFFISCSEWGFCWWIIYMTTGNERGSGVKNFHKKLMQFSIAFSKTIFFLFFANFICISSLEKAATDLI